MWAARRAGTDSAAIVYEVTATIAPELAEAWLAWIRDEHAAQVLATGCFTSAAVERESATRIRVRYTAPDRDAVERYLRDHAPRLREEGLRRFPSGVSYARSTWEQLWGGAASPLP